MCIFVCNAMQKKKQRMLTNVLLIFLDENIYNEENTKIFCIFKHDLPHFCQCVD